MGVKILDCSNDAVIPLDVPKDKWILSIFDKGIHLDLSSFIPSEPKENLVIYNSQQKLVAILMRSAIEENFNWIEKCKSQAKNIDNRFRIVDTPANVDELESRSYARVGLLGNPSDGYSGKTLSSTIENYFATCRLIKYKSIHFSPNPIGDCNHFVDLLDMQTSLRKNGYDGGLKLLMATTKTFLQVCKEEKIILQPTSGFSMSYFTTIPRQLGLAGSSAICTAVFLTLMKWFGVPSEYIPPEKMASYVLRVEQKELGIAAGLQDRVSQAFDCPVFMDFTPQAFALHSNMHGTYVPINFNPRFFENKLYLLFTEIEEGKSSGQVHSQVKKLWEQGDKFARETMTKIAELAEEGRRAVETNNDTEFIRLMNKNFDLRLELFGNAVSEKDKLLILKARSFGPDVGAKLPGSGGVVLAFAKRGDEFQKFIKNSGITVVSLKLRPLRKIISTL